MKNMFTIKEICQITGKSNTTVYRYIKSGKLPSSIVENNGQKTYLVKKLDLEAFFGHIFEEVEKGGKPHEKHMENHVEVDGKHVFHMDKEILQEAVFQAISQQQSQIMKPMEEQAFYLVGELKNELKHLQAEKETLRRENELLREQVKALPGPAELEVKENTILLLQEEKEGLLSKVEEYKNLPEKLEDTVRKLQDKEEEMTDLEAKLQKEKEETELRVLQEKEEALKEQEVKLLKDKAEAEAMIKAEKEELEAKLKAEEEEKARAKAEAEEALKQLKELPVPVESIQQILLDNAKNIKELAKEKETFQTGFKEQEVTIKEKERALKELDELHRQELEKLKQEHERTLKLMSESAEKEKIEIVEAWKKKTEELERPWWKFW